jgi:hypothetical protein
MKREYLDDPDDEVADGESVRVPVFLTDTVRFEDGEPHFVRATAGADLDLADHQPGFRYATDAARAAVRDARNEMIRRAENAWRTPARDAAEPDNGSSAERMRTYLQGAPAPHDDPAASLRGHLQTERNEENQRRRDAAWNLYKDRLSRAYLQGRTDPSRATEIERQGERWRHGR